MLIYSILLLILLIAVNLRRDLSIFISRVSFIILLYLILISLESISLTSLEKGIGLYEGLFHYTCNTQIFNLFIFIIFSIIVSLTGLYPIKIPIKQFSFLVKYYLLIMSVNLLFKVSAVPFHFWSPGVYDAIPTRVTTFVSIVSKISILIFFLVLVHYTNNTFFSYKFTWTITLLLSSFFSLIVGTILGLTQISYYLIYLVPTILINSALTALAGLTVLQLLVWKISGFFFIVINLILIKLGSLFLTEIEGIKFAYKDNFIFYRGRKIQLNPVQFLLLFITSTCLFLILLCLDINSIIKNVELFFQDPVIWITNHSFELVFAGIATVFSSKILFWFNKINFLIINHSFDYACQQVYFQMLLNMYINIKPFLSIYTSILIVSYLNPWFLLPLSLLTVIFTCYISVLSVIYLYINKQFKNKYPVLFFLLILVCLILIGICILSIINISPAILRDIKSYILKMNTGNSNNNPQGFPDPSGSTGGPHLPGNGGNNTPYIFGETWEQERERKRMEKNIEKNRRLRESRQFATRHQEQEWERKRIELNRRRRESRQQIRTRQQQQQQQQQQYNYQQQSDYNNYQNINQNNYQQQFDYNNYQNINDNSYQQQSDYNNYQNINQSNNQDSYQQQSDFYSNQNISQQQSDFYSNQNISQQQADYNNYPNNNQQQFDYNNTQNINNNSFQQSDFLNQNINQSNNQDSYQQQYGYDYYNQNNNQDSFQQQSDYYNQNKNQDSYQSQSGFYNDQNNNQQQYGSSQKRNQIGKNYIVTESEWKQDQVERRHRQKIQHRENRVRKKAANPYYDPKAITSFNKDLNETNKAINLDKSLPENQKSNNRHLQYIQREYPTFFDESSGNKNNPQEGLKQVKDYLEEEKKCVK